MGDLAAALLVGHAHEFLRDQVAGQCRAQEAALLIHGVGLKHRHAKVTEVHFAAVHDLGGHRA